MGCFRFTGDELRVTLTLEILSLSVDSLFFFYFSFELCNTYAFFQVAITKLFQERDEYNGWMNGIIAYSTTDNRRQTTNQKANHFIRTKGFLFNFSKTNTIYYVKDTFRLRPQ